MTTITDRITGLSSGLAVKAPVKVATTANITLNGLQTIDGVTVVANDRVLVKNQTTGAENGIYVASTSDWQRAKDFDGIGDAVQGTLIPVAQGTVSAGIIYEVTTATFTIGTTALVFSATADTTVGAYVAEIQIVADNIDDVNDVSSNIATVIAVNANEANINAVNANEANINAVALIDTDVTTVSGISADVTAVAANEANINTVVANIVDIQNAEENADIAAAAAITATAQAAKLTGTSTSSIAIGTGTKVFTTQADKDFNGNNVRVFSDADPTNYMDGLASYSGTTLTVTVTAVGGSGTFTDWTIRVNGARGAAGTAGNLADGDYTDIVVSGSGTVMTLQPEALTEKATVAPAVDDLALGSDTNNSGSLYKNTWQNILSLLLGLTNTWTKAQTGAVSAVTSTSGTLTLDFATSNNFSITLTENTLLANPTNITAGQEGFIHVTQHASSAKTFGISGGYWGWATGSEETMSTTLSSQVTYFYTAVSATKIWLKRVNGGVA